MLEPRHAPLKMGIPIAHMRLISLANILNLIQTYIEYSAGTIVIYWST